MPKTNAKNNSAKKPQTKTKSKAKQSSPASPRHRQPPYLKKLGQRGPISIWRIDGAFVRTNLDEEFSDYGHPYNYKFIPKHEFWIDEATPDETKFFIHHLLLEYRARQKGLSDDEARKKADESEMKMRKKAGDVKKVKAPNQLADPSKVHLRLWKKLEEPVSVWIVDGRLVRSVFDIDFTEGGHEHVYEFVPQGEVWIDNDVSDAERPYVLLHELHERNLMDKGWDYDRAHADSSKLEKHMRQNPNEVHEALAAEGWE